MFKICNKSLILKGILCLSVLGCQSSAFSQSYNDEMNRMSNSSGSSVVITSGSMQSGGKPQIMDPSGTQSTLSLGALLNAVAKLTPSQQADIDKQAASRRNQAEKDIKLMLDQNRNVVLIGPKGVVSDLNLGSLLVAGIKAHAQVSGRNIIPGTQAIALELRSTEAGGYKLYSFNNKGQVEELTLGTLLQNFSTEFTQVR